MKQSSVLNHQQRRTTAAKKKNPPRLLAGGSSGFVIPVRESSPEYTPAQCSLDSSTYTPRDCRNGPLNPLLVERHPFGDSPLIRRVRAIRSYVKRTPSDACRGRAGNTTSVDTGGALKVELLQSSSIHPVHEERGSVPENALQAGDRIRAVKIRIPCPGQRYQSGQ